MSDEQHEVQVWTLAHAEVEVPQDLFRTGLTAERLSALRAALAATGDVPTATLEVHSLPQGLDRSTGRTLPAASPLARSIADFARQAVRDTNGTSTALKSGETLYRMVVDPKVAKQLGQGLVTPVASRSVAGGFLSALKDSNGHFVSGGMAYVPVAEGGVAVGTAIAAGPLMLMGVAVGISAYAEYQQQQQLERIESALKELKKNHLDQELNQLEASRRVIAKATSVALDEGQVGITLGIDSAAHQINAASAAAERRLREWQTGLKSLGQGPVQVSQIVETFPGIEMSHGEFRAHLELAFLAISLRRRLAIIQALDHAQLNPNSSLERFLTQLALDERDATELESALFSLLETLSHLPIEEPHGIKGVPRYTASDLAEVGNTHRALRELGERADRSVKPNAVVIEMAHNADGSVTVFPALSEQT